MGDLVQGPWAEKEPKPGPLVDGPLETRLECAVSDDEVKNFVLDRMLPNSRFGYESSLGHVVGNGNTEMIVSHIQGNYGLTEEQAANVLFEHIRTAAEVFELPIPSTEEVMSW